MSNGTHRLAQQQAAEQANRARSAALIQMRDRLHSLELTVRNLEGRIRTLETPPLVTSGYADVQPFTPEQGDRIKVAIADMQSDFAEGAKRMSELPLADSGEGDE